MRRQTLSIAVYLLAGTTLTVAAAWFCAISAELGKFDIRYDGPGAGSRLSSGSRIPDDWQVGTHAVRTGPGVHYELVTEMVWMGSKPGAMAGRQNRSVERVEVGWPWPTMEWIGEMDYRNPRPNQPVATAPWVWAQGLPPPVRTVNLSMGANRRLPLVPLLPGFVLSTALFAGAAATLSWAWHTAHRAHRRRHGLCLRCAYPRGPGPVCSECGAPLTTNA